METRKERAKIIVNKKDGAITFERSTVFLEFVLFGVVTT